MTVQLYVSLSTFGGGGHSTTDSPAARWEKVDVTGSTVPEEKPLPITRTIKIKKTAGLDEGISSFSFSNSRLYVESL